MTGHVFSLLWRNSRGKMQTIISLYIKYAKDFVAFSLAEIKVQNYNNNSTLKMLYCQRSLLDMLQNSSSIYVFRRACEIFVCYHLKILMFNDWKRTICSFLFYYLLFLTMLSMLLFLISYKCNCYSYSFQYGKKCLHLKYLNSLNSEFEN